MNLLSKVSYYKIHWIGTMCEIRSTLNVLGLLSNSEAEKKNKRDVYKVIDLTRNLNDKDRKKLM